MVQFEATETKIDVAGFTEKNIVPRTSRNIIRLVNSVIRLAMELADIIVLHVSGRWDWEVAVVHVEAVLEGSLVRRQRLRRHTGLPSKISSSGEGTLGRGCSSIRPPWPFVVGVEESVPDLLPEVVVVIRDRHPLQLAVRRHHLVCVDKADFDAPNPQCPPPLLIAVETLHSVD